MKYPNKEQYKELDELMTYILDEMWGIDDKQLIREGIITYSNTWHEIQSNKEIKEIKLLKACREYDSSGKDRPDGYILPNYHTAKRQSDDD